RAGGLDRLAGAVEHAHIGDRAARARARALDLGALRADGGEVVAHAAAAAHGLGGFLQRGIDARAALDHLGDRVAHRLHEAVDQGGLQVDPGCGIDAAGGNEAFLLRLQEASLPLGAVGFTLDLGEGSGDAAPDLRDALLAVLGVLLEQGIPADFLLSGRGGEMNFHGTGRLYSGARGARAPGETDGLAEKLVAGGGDRRRGFA